MCKTKRDAFKVLSRQSLSLLPPATNSVLATSHSGAFNSFTRIYSSQKLVKTKLWSNSGAPTHTCVQNNITTVFQILLHASTFESKVRGFRVRCAVQICHQADRNKRDLFHRACWWQLDAAFIWQQSEMAVAAPQMFSVWVLSDSHHGPAAYVPWITWSSHVCSLILLLWGMKARSVREKEVGMCSNGGFWYACCDYLISKQGWSPFRGWAVTHLFPLRLLQP